MLHDINNRSYAFAPAALKTLSAEEGIWFYPGEETHELMKALTNLTGRQVRDATKELESVSIMLGAPETDERQRETIVKVSFDLLGEDITGKMHVRVEANTLEAEAYKPFLLVRDEVVETIAELEALLEEVQPAITGLTF